MKTSKKVLVPLATLAAAGAVAIGSGATFTSESNNAASAVTSGTVKQTNDKNGLAIVNLDNMKPGDTVNGTVTLTNTGSLPAAFSLTETASTNGFAGANLTLTITRSGASVPVYDGTFGGLVDGAKNDLGALQPGEAKAYRFTVKLDQNAPNSEQGKTASAAYKWDSVQLDGQTYDQ